MKRLNFEEIKGITFGALSITKEEDGIHFYKCTAKQNEVWANLSDDLGRGALTTSGVRFDFLTNSEHIRFSASSGGKFEIWVDGLLKEQIKSKGANEGISVANIELGKGEKRVIFAFPSHSIGVLDFFEIDDNSFVTPSQHDKKILFLGDSITQGWDAFYDTLSYAYRTSMYFDADSIIQGIGGAPYHKSAFDMDIAYDPDIVIVELGTNDYLRYRNVEIVINGAKEYLSLVKQKFADKRIVVITPTWRADMDKEPLKGNFLPIRDGIEKAAIDLNFEVVDGFKLLPHIEEFFADGYLHPNDNGFSLYAANLIKALTK